MTKSKEKERILLMLAGIAINILGNRLGTVLGISFFPGAIGTVLVAVLAGYLPGIVTGFISTLAEAVFVTNTIYYGLPAIVLAAVSAWLAHRGIFEKWYKAILAIPALVCTYGVVHGIISWLVRATDIADQEMFSELNGLSSSALGSDARFGTDIPYVCLEIGITIALVFIILKLIPAEKRQFFSQTAYDRICSDKDILSEKDHANPRRSVKTRIVAIVMTGILLVIIASAVITYHLYKESTISECIRLAEGLTKLAVDAIDPDHVTDYLAKGKEADGYLATESRLYQIQASYPNVEYLYVYRILEDGCHVVFDLDTEMVPGQEPGEVAEFDQSFDAYREALLAGDEVPTIISNDTYGYLLTVYKPLYDNSGHCVCYVGIDFSMNDIRLFGYRFILRIMMIMSGFLVIILLLILACINGSIIAPINGITRITQSFSYDTKESREQNLRKIRSLSIQTGDEIENLHQTIIKNTEDSLAQEKKQQEQTERISAINEIYANMYEVDMITMSISVLKYVSFAFKEKVEKNDTDAQTLIKQGLLISVDEPFLDAALEFADLSTLNDRLRDTDIITLEIRTKFKTWSRCRIIVSCRDKEGNVTKFLWLAEDIDKEVRARERLHEIAFTDALTGLGNKSAYDEATRPFDEAIAAGSGEDLSFAILMIDLNFLKKVNDTYGHENGNIYLVNCGNMVRKIYGESNSYRFGGDEFVVVLSGKKARESESLTSEFKAEIKRLQEDPTLKPWEKVSAAVGISHFDPATDISVEEVFKRADQNMYEDKIAMKAERKD